MDPQENEDRHVQRRIGRRRAEEERQRRWFSGEPVKDSCAVTLSALPVFALLVAGVTLVGGR